jgi:hypothetical protein
VGIRKSVNLPSLGKVSLRIVVYILSEYCQQHAKFFNLLFMPGNTVIKQLLINAFSASRYTICLPAAPLLSLATDHKSKIAQRKCIFLSLNIEMFNG